MSRSLVLAASGRPLMATVWARGEPLAWTPKSRRLQLASLARASDKHPFILTSQARDSQSSSAMDFTTTMKKNQELLRWGKVNDRSHDLMFLGHWGLRIMSYSSQSGASSSAQKPKTESVTPERFAEILENGSKDYAKYFPGLLEQARRSTRQHNPSWKKIILYLSTFGEMQMAVKIYQLKESEDRNLWQQVIKLLNESLVDFMQTHAVSAVLEKTKEMEKLKIPISDKNALLMFVLAVKDDDLSALNYIATKMIEGEFPKARSEHVDQLLTRIEYHLISRHLSKALDMINIVPKLGDAVSMGKFWSLLIKSMIAVGDFDLTVNGLNLMRKNGVLLTLKEYGFLAASTIAQSKRLDSMTRIYEDMEKTGVEPDLWFYKLVINAFATLRCHEQVNEAINRMFDAGIECDREIFDVLLNLMMQREHADSIPQILELMELNSFKPTALQYVQAIAYCTSIARGDLVELLYDIIVNNNVKTDQVIYSAVLKAFFQSNNLDGVDKLREVIREQDCLDDLMCNLLMEGYAQTNISKAQQLLNELKSSEKIKPTATTYDYLLQSPHWSSPDQALACFQEMRDQGLTPTQRSYQAILTLFKFKNATKKQVMSFLDRILEENVELEDYNLFLISDLCLLYNLSDDYTSLFFDPPTTTSKYGGKLYHLLSSDPVEGIRLFAQKTMQDKMPISESALESLEEAFYEHGTREEVLKVKREVNEKGLVLPQDKRDPNEKELEARFQRCIHKLAHETLAIEGGKDKGKAIEANNNLRSLS